MKKLFLLITSCALFLNLSSKLLFTEVKAEPRERVVQCSKSYSQLSKTATQIGEIYRRTGEIAVPGSTFTVTHSYNITISNSAAITAVPEFLSLGYEWSYMAGTTTSWSKTNSTNRNLELVIKAFYDSYNVTSFVETSPGSGACTINYSSRKVYRGWGYDLS